MVAYEAAQVLLRPFTAEGDFLGRVSQGFGEGWPCGDGGKYSMDAGTRAVQSKSQRHPKQLVEMGPTCISSTHLKRLWFFG